jgi:hypothetical protein
MPSSACWKGSVALQSPPKQNGAVSWKYQPAAAGKTFWYGCFVNSHCSMGECGYLQIMPPAPSQHSACSNDRHAATFQACFGTGVTMRCMCVCAGMKMSVTVKKTGCAASGRRLK